MCELPETSEPIWLYCEDCSRVLVRQGRDCPNCQSSRVILLVNEDDRIRAVIREIEVKARRAIDAKNGLSEPTPLALPL